jgi:hypothetical protein
MSGSAMHWSLRLSPQEIRTRLVMPRSQSGGSVMGGEDALSPYLENRIVLERRTNKQHCSVYFGHIVLSCYHVNMNP